MPDAKPMSPERIAEIDVLCEITAGIRRDGGSSHLGDPRYSCVIGSDRVEAMTAAIPELLAEVRRLQSAVDRLANAERDLAETNLAMDQQERDRDRIRSERDIARSRLDISESHGRDKDARIAALEAGLREALGRWEYPSPTHADKARKDELWQLLQSNNPKET